MLSSNSSHSSHEVSVQEDEMETKRQQLYNKGKHQSERPPSAEVESDLSKQGKRQQEEIRRLKVCTCQHIQHTFCLWCTQHVYRNVCNTYTVMCTIHNAIHR